MNLKLAQSLYLRCSSALPSSRIKIKPADTAHLNSIGGTIFSFDFDYFGSILFKSLKLYVILYFLLWFLVGRDNLGKKAYDALLLDAGGTLLQLAKPVAETYAEIGQKYG